MASEELIDRTLYCGNLSHETTEELLYELFVQAGPVQMVKIITDKDGNRRNFAFITFTHEISVPYTVDLMNGIMLNNKPLQLKYRKGSSHEKNDILGLDNENRSNQDLSQNNVKGLKYQNIFEKIILQEIERIKPPISKKKPSRFQSISSHSIRNTNIQQFQMQSSPYQNNIPIQHVNHSAFIESNINYPSQIYPHDLLNNFNSNSYMPQMPLANNYFNQNYIDYDNANNSQYFSPTNHKPYHREYSRDESSRHHNSSSKKHHSHSRERSYHHKSSKRH